MANGYGGARPGAGRKPKALVYAGAIEAAEQTIVEAMPAILAKLVELAKGGDVAAARYLVDRVMGRIAAGSAAPACDTSIPYSEREYVRDSVYHDKQMRHCEENYDTETKARALTVFDRGSHYDRIRLLDEIDDEARRFRAGAGLGPTPRAALAVGGAVERGRASP